MNSPTGSLGLSRDGRWLVTGKGVRPGIVKTLSVGDALGRYELLCPIAKGGMAQVWAARLRGSRGFQKVVAIKTMLSGALDDRRMERMFQQEAELAAHIQHPNVAATLELGEERGILYLVMEWVNGEPLRYVLHEAAQRGGMPLAQAVHLIGQACRGLHAAHEACDHRGVALGIVHRDISPHNVLVTYSGTVKLVDFGVAKAESGSDELTEHGELKGKLAFMSPEQLAGRALDRRSDIFALGGILYWLVAGQHPFRADSPAVTRDKICAAVPPPPPSRSTPACSPALDRAVMRALEFEPEARWATARELLDALVVALPEAFDNDADLRLSQYMRGLFDNRAQLRVQQLELAQDMVDRMRSGPGGSGSMPAVTIGTATGGRGESELAALDVDDDRPRSLPAALASASPPRARSTHRARATLRTFASGAGAALVVALVVAWWLSRHAASGYASGLGPAAELEPVGGRLLAPRAHGAAPEPGASERAPELERTPIAAVPTSVATPPAPAAPTPRATNEPSPAGVEAASAWSDAALREAPVLDAPSRAPRKVVVPRRKTAPAASAPSPPMTPTAPAAPDEKEKKANKVDIWDLNNFGGRN